MSDKRTRFLSGDEILLIGESEGVQNLTRFNRAIEKGETPEREILQFLAHAFAGILGGDDPKDALKLRTKQGRKAPTSAEIDRRMVERVVPVIKLMRDGLTRDKAIERVSEETGLGV